MPDYFTTLRSKALSAQSNCIFSFTPNQKLDKVEYVVKQKVIKIVIDHEIFTFLVISSNSCFCYFICRSSRPEVFCKKGLLKNLTKFTGKHFCWSIFLIKLQAFNLIESNSNTAGFLWIFYSGLSPWSWIPSRWKSPWDELKVNNRPAILLKKRPPKGCYCTTDRLLLNRVKVSHVRFHWPQNLTKRFKMVNMS